VAKEVDANGCEWVFDMGTRRALRLIDNPILCSHDNTNIDRSSIDIGNPGLA
jgi:hypothetical protein